MCSSDLRGRAFPCLGVSAKHFLFLVLRGLSLPAQNQKQKMLSANPEAREGTPPLPPNAGAATALFQPARLTAPASKKQFFSKLPIPVLEMLGKIFYRHMG